ncbi:MAG: 1-acyl-sn-glycerol-3-phosphate acyltransferase [Clostridia bacterium]|nr:1-acyl-sn-glycerol-3-phosphate acyltransferase [Clostridia bacterium]
MIFWLIKIITFIPFILLFPCRLVNKKKIPKGKAILVCNHRSNIDYIYLFTHIGRKQFVLAKQELFKNKFVGGFFKKCGGVPVDRNNISLSTIKSCVKILKDEKLLTIFPEGTRNKTGEDLLEFKAGASVFAVKTGAPIVPMYIKKKPRFFGFNKVVIGEPIYFDESFKGEEGMLRANEIIRQKMLELKDK